MAKTLTKQLLSQAYQDRRYRGKQIFIVEGKIFAAGTGRQAVKLFKQLLKAYPKETPLVTCIPKADYLIL